MKVFHYKCEDPAPLMAKSMGYKPLAFLINSKWIGTFFTLIILQIFSTNWVALFLKNYFEYL